MKKKKNKEYKECFNDISLFIAESYSKLGQGYHMVGNNNNNTKAFISGFKRFRSQKGHDPCV